MQVMFSYGEEKHLPPTTSRGTGAGAFSNDNTIETLRKP